MLNIIWFRPVCTVSCCVGPYFGPGHLFVSIGGPYHAVGDGLDLGPCMYGGACGMMPFGPIGICM